MERKSIRLGEYDYSRPGAYFVTVCTKDREHLFWEETPEINALLPLTGYVHGGCSPVGMKKLFPTVFHQTALDHAAICVSAGKVGFQVEVDPAALIALVRGRTADLVVEEEI